MNAKLERTPTALTVRLQKGERLPSKSVKQVIDKLRNAIRASLLNICIEQNIQFKFKSNIDISKVKLTKTFRHSNPNQYFKLSETYSRLNSYTSTLYHMPLKH
ncbi:hypothetical protein MAR_018874 [Mya arenaria]|uniref:Uncharacterized protein n=1 Tax=Mya arenaria TaxID=6604 RepID=A0ABY7EJE2_MYAAR|nr:hypothetical protein MAR_018874 [Mya arenaria]